VDTLIEAVGRLRRERDARMEVIVVGSVLEELQLKALAKGRSWCLFTGPFHDRERLSRIFRASDAVVIPGYVGLAVNHAFAHGLPVITCH
jgi:glycosyltransferase involved in cell wall biosynthesis